MKKYKRPSFQLKLLGLFLGVITLFAVIYAAYYSISKKMIQKNMISYSEIYVDSITGSITDMVQEIDRLSKTFLLEAEMIHDLGLSIPEDEPEYVDYYWSVRDSLERTLNVRIDIEGILIADAAGRVITGGPNAPYREGMSLAGETWYEEFMQSGKMFEVMSLQKVNATDSFSIVRKLRSYEVMQVNGLVRIDMKKSLLDQICNKRRLDQNSVILFDKNKTVFYISGNAPNDQQIEAIKSQLPAVDGNFRILAGGGDFNVSSRYSEYLDMYVAYVVPQHILMSDLNDLNNSAVALLLLGGFIGIALAIGASRLMSRGVAKVMAGMQEVEAGNLDVTIEVESNDEIDTIAGGLNHMIKRIKVLMEEKAQIEVKKKETEMMMLQRQIRPHFLYNTLDGIRMKALLNQDQETAEMIEKLSTLLRRTTDMKTEYVTLQEEMEYVSNYIDLQNLRFHYKFQLSVNIPEAAEKLIIPKFSLQPLIENAVHHGLERRKMNRCIWVDVELLDGQAMIKVSDNGSGISPERLNEIRETLETPDMMESEHIGLNNINIRLKLYYGKEYGLTIDSEIDQGTCLIVCVPIQY